MKHDQLLGPAEWETRLGYGARAAARDWTEQVDDACIAESDAADRLCMYEAGEWDGAEASESEKRA